MLVSDEIIKVLEYLCSKIGITIDWTNNNVLPYIEQICAKFIKWEIATSVTWIALAIASTVIVFLIRKSIIASDKDYTFYDDLVFFVNLAFYGALFVSIIVIGEQAFDIVECCTFPEKTIYDYVQSMIANSRR